jgi:hypothetical protein
VSILILADMEENENKHWLYTRVCYN